jgi:aspartate kinase
MKVIKIGGGCLNGKNTIAHIVDLIGERAAGHVVVVSALSGITDFLIHGMQAALSSEAQIPPIISRLKAKHLNIAQHLIRRQAALKTFRRELNRALQSLERYYYGLNFTREISARMQDMISSYGERLSAILLATILSSRRKRTAYRMPHKIGIITDGKFGDATVKPRPTADNLQAHLNPLVEDKRIVIVPGFFGISSEGEVTTFGRGGSDYSAAVVAAALDAELLEIWKDVDGFMSADPRWVPEAQLIPVLSYEEAAELAYFGAKILHPRSVEPIRSKRLKIAIKNTLNPDAQGSLITPRGRRAPTIIKSVSYDSNIGIIKVHASGVGARPGILAQVAGRITDSGINIKSVVTSQTCISLLLERKDLQEGRQALTVLKPKPFRRLEILEDVALISIVGDGLLRQKGIAARCFSAVAGCGVNVEMISFGPSRAALYFLTKIADLRSAVNAIHSTFFATPRCY